MYLNSLLMCTEWKKKYQELSSTPSPAKWQFSISRQHKPSDSSYHLYAAVLKLVLVMSWDTPIL